MDSTPPSRSRPADAPWLPLAGLLLLAAGLRVLFYSGYFGSDEVTYTESAFKLLRGDWSVSSYVGANRYGVNLPVAAIAALLGRNEVAAALYSVACSLAEIALVVVIGSQMVGRRAACFAGLVLATLPMHAHLAGRLLADSPLALAITAGFLLFWLGEARGSRPALFAAGLAVGWSFWIKPAAVFYVLVLMSYPVVFRRWSWRWSWVVAGFALMVLANCALFWALTGRFWYLFEVMSARRSSGYLQEEFAAGNQHEAAWYYLEYLYAKVWHTWLLGPLALAGAVLVLWRARAAEAVRAHGLHFALWWGAGLMLVLSLFVVSTRPLTLVPKQTNYMLMFAAPLALLAGCALASLRGRAFGLAVLAWTVPAVLLCGLLQGTITVFTANAKAVHRWAAERPQAVVYATTNPYRYAQFHATVHPEARPPDVRFVGDLAPRAAAAARPPRPAGEAYAVIDEETLSWGSGEPYRRLADVPACWVPQGTLPPVVAGGGPALAAGVARLVPPDSPWAGRLRRLHQPAPAHLYRVPAGC
ncbi:MAG: glycosyltransferase family 39 protein [Rubrivivax sp.]|nr:glycosyltransferase family 39 protein [Rubrivivax sp.]